MDLTVETWQEGKNTMVSMCHYGEQNILFKVEQEIITYREIQMAYTAYYSEDHAEIKDFMENTWVDNLIQQGHKLYEKDIEA